MEELRPFILPMILLLLAISFLRPRRRCPRCSAELPRLRKPRSAMQTFWGGWTCETCGAEVGVNLWGRPRV